MPLLYVVDISQNLVSYGSAVHHTRCMKTTVDNSPHFTLRSKECHQWIGS